jgi:hypothetical protein
VAAHAILFEESPLLAGRGSVVSRTVRCAGYKEGAADGEYKWNSGSVGPHWIFVHYRDGKTVNPTGIDLGHTMPQFKVLQYRDLKQDVNQTATRK